MKTYAAMSNTSVTMESLRQAQHPHVLASFTYDPEQRIFDALGYDLQSPMVDSGAYSAWMKGGVVDLGDYIDWAKRYAERYPMVRITNLDVIPGSAAARHPSPKEQARAVDESRENAAAIRAAGLRVIEVHHQFDPPAEWPRMIERRQPGEVLGLGGIARSVMQQMTMVQAFGDSCFGVLRDMCGWDALPPVHAFGASSLDIGFRYPLSSVDASSWVAPSRYGAILRKGRIRKQRDEAVTRALYHPTAYTVEQVRILRDWQAREEKLRKLWQDRGVNILEEGPALVSASTAA